MNNLSKCLRYYKNKLLLYFSKKNFSVERIIILISFVLFSISLTYSAFLLKAPTGDPAAVYFPVLAKLIDGQGLASFIPLRMGLSRTPGINLMAYVIHLIFRTNVLMTVRIFLILNSLGILTIFYLLIAKMLSKRCALLSVWLIFLIPDFQWLNIHFLTDIPSFLFMLIALYLILFYRLKKVWRWIIFTLIAVFSAYIRPPVYLFLIAAIFPLGMVFRVYKLPWKKIIFYAVIFYLLLGIISQTIIKDKSTVQKYDGWNRSIKSIKLENGFLKNAVKNHTRQFFGELAKICSYRLHIKIIKDSFKYSFLLIPIVIGFVIFSLKGWHNRTAYALLGLFFLNLPMVAVIHYEARYTILLYFFYSVLISLFFTQMINLLVKKVAFFGEKSSLIIFIGFICLAAFMSSKTIVEHNKYQIKINNMTIPAHKIFDIMLANKIDQPLDILYQRLINEYFPERKVAKRTLRYFTNYRYYTYSELNYINNISPYKDLLIEQDNEFPHQQEPEDMALMGGYMHMLPQLPMLDPVKIAEQYKVILANTTDYIVQSVAQKIPYNRTAIPITVYDKDNELTEKLTDKNSFTWVDLKPGNILLTKNSSAFVNEIMLFPKWNGKFPQQLSVSVFSVKPQAQLLNKDKIVFSQNYNNPISIEIKPYSGKELLISLDSENNDEIVLGEIFLFSNKYENQREFREVEGKIVNRSFMEETDGLPTGWAFDSISYAVTPILISRDSKAYFRWIKLENNKKKEPIKVFQEVELKPGFYAISFLGNTTGKPSNYCQIDFLKTNEENWHQSAYERINKPDEHIYVKTFFLDKPAKVRFNFVQYIPKTYLKHKKAITYITELRLFKLEND